MAAHAKRKRNMFSDGRYSFLDKVKNQRFMLLMAAPGVLTIIVFGYIPLVALVIAFTNYTIAKPMSPGEWVGLQHFIEFFKSDDLIMTLRNTFGISFFKLLIGFPLPIILAILLNEIPSKRFKKYVQTISYLPHFISWVIIGGILTTWLADNGIVTQLLVKMGLIEKPIFLLGKPEYFWSIVVSSDIWKELGFRTIIYIAAITAIDPGLYEAAKIDGAGRWARIWHITLPGISGTIAILLILSVANMLNTNFDQIFTLRNVLNKETSEVLNIYVYSVGIKKARYSYAAAVGLIRSLASLTLLFSANAITKKTMNQSLF